MARRPADAKTRSLKEHGCLNPHAERVRDELFLSNPFFDPRDLLQVRYEMLRRVSASVRTDVDIRQEIQTRLTFQEEKRQPNIEAVVWRAADELGDREVDAHDIDHDWTAEFFSDVQDVSSEAMQTIWAKILAGEVERPGHARSARPRGADEAPSDGRRRTDTSGTTRRCGASTPASRRSPPSARSKATSARSIAAGIACSGSAPGGRAPPSRGARVCPNVCVRRLAGIFVSRPQRAEAGKRSSNRMANCPIAAVQATGRFQRMPALRIAR